MTGNGKPIPIGHRVCCRPRPHEFFCVIGHGEQCCGLPRLVVVDGQDNRFMVCHRHVIDCGSKDDLYALTHIVEGSKDMRQ